MQTWTRYWLHLVVAVFAALGAASGLSDASSLGGLLFWLLCLAAALLNAVMFGVGWERSLIRHDSTGHSAR